MTEVLFVGRLAAKKAKLTLCSVSHHSNAIHKSALSVRTWVTITIMAPLLAWKGCAQVDSVLSCCFNVTGTRDSTLSIGTHKEKPHPLT